MERKKVTLATIQDRKNKGEKLTMLTAYDYPTAVLLDEVGIDIVLVGDSLGNVVLGYPDTIPVTMDEMIHHTKAVKRGLTYAYLVGDMPFLSYQVSEIEAIKNAGRFVKEAGADCVKLEGGVSMAGLVKTLVGIGIPVMGHIGLTPQSAQVLGGYRVQGRDADTAKELLDDALELEAAGAFSIVLECVPAEVMAEITSRLNIPTIGIGAGINADGQVLVINDLLGIRSGFAPKFVKRWADLNEISRKAVSEYKQEVESGSFPADEHTFMMDEEELQKFKKLI